MGVRTALFVLISMTLLFSTTPAFADGSGSIDWTCDMQEAKHYANKGIQLYNQGSYHDAFYAFSASIAATKACKAVQFNPVWMYWIHTMEALADYKLGDYFDANAVLVASSFWKARIPAIVTPTDARIVAATDKTVGQLQAGIAAYRSAASRPAPVPVRSQYESGMQKTYSDCDSDSIDSISDDGSVITMVSGATYSVVDVDQATSSVWVSAEDVIICDKGNHFEIIDKDQDNDHVDAEKIQ